MSMCLDSPGTSWLRLIWPQNEKKSFRYCLENSSNGVCVMLLVYLYFLIFSQIGLKVCTARMNSVIKKIFLFDTIAQILIGKRAV